MKLLAVAAALLTTGCCHNDSPSDTTQFPDLSGYTAVNADDYRVDASTPGQSASQVVFLTPDGITCAFSTPPSAGCTGNNFPAVPPAQGGVNAVGTDFGLDTTNAPIARTPDIKTLPPFHSLTVDGVTCGVDDARTTACRDTKGRGFVLSPSGSTWFAHI